MVAHFCSDDIENWILFDSAFYARARLVNPVFALHAVDRVGTHTLAADTTGVLAWFDVRFPLTAMAIQEFRLCHVNS